MVRTILVTVCEHTITKEKRPFFGRYDPITLERRNWKIVDTFKRKYTMTDETFAKYGTIVEESKEEN